jgi:hypothetical protein
MNGYKRGFGQKRSAEFIDRKNGDAPGDSSERYGMHARGSEPI